MGGMVGSMPKTLGIFGRKGTNLTKPARLQIWQSTFLNHCAFETWIGAPGGDRTHINGFGVLYYYFVGQRFKQSFGHVGQNIPELFSSF
jgi:hypothetical protein